MYNPYQNYYRGINTPSMRSNINPLNGRKKTSLKSMIGTAERSIDTINSIIPLYQKVKPVLDNGKNILTSITSFFNKPVKKEDRVVEKVDVEIVDTPIKNNEKENFDYRNNDDNSTPFFNSN